MKQKIFIVICFCFVLLVAISSVNGATVTIAPNEPGISNCFPFGAGGGWTPYMGFIYQNVPAFNIQPGDILAFDLGLQNDTDIQLDIAMASTLVNGGTQETGAFTTVVTNTQTPANPRGDTTIGNFEVQFTVESPFNFSGGGLIIRFSNPSVSYLSDPICDQVLVETSSGDSSGFFVERFYADSDGQSPWSNEETDSYIGGFQVIFDICTSDADCNDGQFCNGTETCDIPTGSCVAVSACPPAIDGCVTRGGFCNEVSDMCEDVADDGQCLAGEMCDINTGNCIPAAQAVTDVPTMGQWGMVIFLFLAGLAAVFYLRRRRIE